MHLLKGLTWNEIKDKFIPQRTTLAYVDRGDTLDNKPRALNDWIHAEDNQPLWELTDEWWSEAEQWHLNQYVDELEKDLRVYFEGEHISDDDHWEVEGMYEEAVECMLDPSLDPWGDWVVDTIYDRNDTDLLPDLLSNTTDPALFYETGAEAYSQDDLEEMRVALGILGTDFDDQLLELINHTYGGGRLLIYFNLDLADVLEAKRNGKWVKYNHINIQDPIIALVNHGEGSGDHVQLNGYTLSIPFMKENLHVCEAVHYSYTHDTCGMYDDWCSGPSVELTQVDGEQLNLFQPLPNSSSVSEHMKLEEQYEQRFREGNCSAEDRNFKRHRDVTYINNFPCGLKCPHCGRFWID